MRQVAEAYFFREKMRTIGGLLSLVFLEVSVESKEMLGVRENSQNNREKGQILREKRAFGGGENGEW